MKRISILALLLITSLSSCVFHDDDYAVQPAGYQYSFIDDFNNDRNRWSFRDDGNNASVYVSGGLLHYDYHPFNSGTNTVAVATGMHTTHDFDIQTRFRSDNAMAIVFGVSQSEFGYSFFIDDHGYFALYDEGNASIPPLALIDWVANGAIHRGGWNDVELEQVGNSWLGYINGAQVFQVPAHTLYGNQVGFMVLANTAGDADYVDIKW